MKILQIIFKQVLSGNVSDKSIDSSIHEIQSNQYCLIYAIQSGERAFSRGCAYSFDGLLGEGGRGYSRGRLFESLAHRSTETANVVLSKINKRSEWILYDSIPLRVRHVQFCPCSAFYVKQPSIPCRWASTKCFTAR